MRFLHSSKLFFASLMFFVAGHTFAADLTVSAASSLTDAFKDISSQFEKNNPKTKISLNFGASGALLQQIDKGAPVDVFATADTQTMDEALGKKLIDAATRREFARNALVLIVPVKSTLSINNLNDLSKAPVKRIAVGNPVSVPVGRYSKQALDKAGLWGSLESKIIKTENVRQSLDYVARGEVDAGFVYATDANVMKDKVKVAFEVPLETAITYPIAITTRSAHKKEAKSFIEFLMSPASQAIFAKYGFLKP